MFSIWPGGETTRMKLACAAGILAGSAGIVGGIWKGSRLSIAVGSGILVSSAGALLATRPAEKVTEVDEAAEKENLEKVLRELHERSKPLPKDVVILDEFSHKAALEAFVSQKGPVCAAASVAGALNVAFGCAVKQPFRVCDSMNIYKTIFEGKRDEALEKLKKVIRVDPAPLLPLIFPQNVCVAARASDKDKFRAALPRAIADAKQRQGLSSEEEEVLSVVEAAISDEAGAAAALALDRLRALAKAEWAVSKLLGRWPLPSGKVLPSTAPVGNDRISLCLRALAMLREGKPVRVTSLMGVKAPCRHLISKKDSAEDRDKQWEELKRSCELPGSAIIFHLHNHYALIFGWREIAVNNSTWSGKRRQLLTARVGQEPAHWVDWDGDFTFHSETKGKDILRKSVVSSLLGWAGHKMMLVELPSFTSKRAVPDAALNKLVDKAKKRALNHAGEMQEDASGAGVGEYLDEGEDAGGASGDEPES